MNRTHGDQYDNVLRIRECLSEIGNAANTFNTEAKKIRQNQLLSEEGKEWQGGVLLAAFTEKVAPYKEKYFKHLNSLEALETQNAEHFDVSDPTLHSIVSLLANGVPLTEALAKPLAGQHQAVSIVQEMCRTKGIKAEALTRYAVNIPNAISKMREVDFGKMPNDAYPTIIKAMNLTAGFADGVGVNLDNDHKELACSVADFRNSQIREAMGLTIDPA